MKPTSGSLLIGVLAGLATALLSISAGEPTALSLLLFAAATLPILIASTGWSNAAGFIAAGVAGVVVSAILSPLAALSFFATTLAPAAWIGHLANLSRPAEELGGPKDALAWYPLSDIMLQLCLLVVAGLIVVGVSLGYGEAMIADVVDQFFAVMRESNAEFQPSDADRGTYVAFFLTALPVIQGALWVLILFTALYLALAIVRASGRGRRPKDDIPTSLRMSRASLYIFGLGLLLTFLGGAAALVGALVCGAMGAGFTLAGFAVFHSRTRGRPWRWLALWSGYLAVFLFTLPVLLFLVIGMVETARAVPVTRAGPPPPGQDPGADEDNS